MELEQARKRAEELRVIIERNNRLYYDQDAPELEDFEYDALTRELKALEAEFPQLVTATESSEAQKPERDRTVAFAGLHVKEGNVCRSAERDISHCNLHNIAAV